MENACVYADSNYWSFGSTQYSWPNPKTYNPTGTLSVATPLGSDPVPFTGNPRQFSKTQSLPPPSTWRAEVYRALSANQDQQARNRISTFLRTGIPALSELKEIGRITREAGWLDLRDTIYTILLTRQDLRSKIIAADMGIEDSLFGDVLEILNAYSFEASPDLMTAALARKAVCYPLAFQGGYVHGLKALDSLRTCVGNDPIYSDFLELYPKLYSALTFEPGPLMPRRSNSRLIEAAIPRGIELWPNYPNPFRDVTSFTFKLGKATHVRLTVHDGMGREVAVLTDADYNRGVHSVVLQSTHLSSGLYFYRFMSDEGVIQRKMMLVR